MENTLWDLQISGSGMELHWNLGGCEAMQPEILLYCRARERSFMVTTVTLHVSNELQNPQGPAGSGPHGFPCGQLAASVLHLGLRCNASLPDELTEWAGGAEFCMS